MGLLVRGEEGGASRVRGPLKGRVAPGFVDANPESDGLGMNAEDLGDLGGRKPVGDTLDREEPTLSQRRLSRGYWYHIQT